jgi:predicted TPR repeat methyltransferase
MPARLFLSSGDLIADRRFDFARDLQLKGDLVAAADLLLQATELAPGFASAWFTLGGIREQLGERDLAIAAFRQALITDPDDRHGASLRLMLLGADRLSAMPPAYVRGRIAEAGLALLKLDELSTRNEDNTPVPGLVVVAGKS